MDNEKMPARTGITVLPADDPNKKRLAWKVYENRDKFYLDCFGTTTPTKEQLKNIEVLGADRKLIPKYPEDNNEK